MLGVPIKTATGFDHVKGKEIFTIKRVSVKKLKKFVESHLRKMDYEQAAHILAKI